MPPSYVLTPSDWADTESLLNAHAPGDDHWVRARQEMCRDELAAGRSSLELLGYVAAVVEIIWANHRPPPVAYMQGLLFRQRLRKEIKLWKRKGAPDA